VLYRTFNRESLGIPSNQNASSEAKLTVKLIIADP
jgi:hypothetical protein